MVYKKNTSAKNVRKNPANTKEWKKKKLFEELIEKTVATIKDFGAEVEWCRCKKPKRPKGMMRIEGMCECGAKLQYKQEYVQDIIDYFSEKTDSMKLFYLAYEEQYYPARGNEEQGALKSKKPVMAVAPAPPTFERWSFEHKITDRTRKEWADEFQDFGEACEMCKDIMDSMITELAMLGKYPANYAIFYQKAKLNYEDKSKLDIGGSGFNLLLLAEQAEEKEAEGN
ncbi:MAG: hypothetical protein DLD55_01775 [candidate division SR1 bacterium]|nr:MAG: hypothetical protein DLD55_01775 [candidate division SR1 bacterium]